MQIDAISSLTMRNLLAEGVRRSQNFLAAAQIEVQTGRHADIGLALGTRSSRDILWRAEMSGIDMLSVGNKLVEARLDLTQSALSSVRDVANTFLQTIAGARSAAGGQVTARQAASTALHSLTNLLNSQFDGQYLFGGIASDTAVLADYQSQPTSAAKSAVDAAFAATFGIAQTDPAVNAISPAAMQGFLDTSFSDLFSASQWKANWTSAADTNVKARIAPGLTVDAGTNGNLEAFRRLAEGLTMALDLGEDHLNETVFQAIVDRAMKLAGEAVLGVGFEQARLGIVQSQVAAQNDQLAARRRTLTGMVSSVESVDPYEAALKINSLQAQLEASYSLTGRIAHLSILNYI